ncbi:hypothetical protein SNE25_15940 [Mucilaginibacter sabulilitoris]|uniref:Uncharacterized protein n=1 Tax=Mucilaginibacter sabulilitoris TaxID=1173583 RepID=A0ABZ0TXY5_9SPHI|nr:hypothetical protein [Mucilaginibacter sabulilitoris]WPU97013.1 hypothetical protein SNE25_15940 [Mucilaginibacter sabulilitoris]
MNEKLNIQLANYVAAYQSMDAPAPPNPPAKPVLTDVEKQVFTAAEKAWERYRDSPQGKEELAATKHMDLPAFRAYVAGLPDNPIFKELISWIKSLDLPVSSFSIGLNVEVEFIVGFSATLGVAVGVGNSKGLQSCEFLSVALEEGIQAGALAGVQFGLWNHAPADLGGRAWALEGDVGLEIEFSLGFYWNSSGPLGVALTVGGGVEEGIAIVESYTFILGDQGVDPYIKPVVQPRKSNFLIIESLKCVHPSNDGTGDENEIYFIFQADGDTAYPYPTYDYFSMKEGDTWACGRSVWFNSSVKVTVYDEDSPSNDDVVGDFSISLSQLALGKSITFNSTKDYSSGLDKVEYTINVKLIA